MSNLRDKYEVVIGLEVHAQLKTKSKIFAPDSTEFGNEQNTQISAITLGMPGVLPVLNKEVVEEIKQEESCECEVKELLLFTSPTCPNCKMAKMLLDKAGVEYKALDAIENKELAVKFQIKKAPTLFVPNEDGYDVMDNVSDIKKYIESLK